MKKTSTADILYSPSDLVTFIRSPFASWMDRLAIETPEAVEDIDTLKDPMMDLLGDKGSKHEHSYLEKLIQQYGEENVAIITGKGDQGTAETHAAMKAGQPVIFQAALKRDNFQGYADFLIKRDGKSKLGEYYYEAWDTKLAKSTRPYFLIQLCAYSWMLEEFQDKRPDEAAIVLGDGTIDQYRISGYYNYFKNALQQFLKQQAEFSPDISAMPDPAMNKDYGQWEDYAKQLLQERDSLTLVANIRKSQIKKLHDVGINTLTGLASTDIDHIKGMAVETFARLKSQAQIQQQSKGKAKPDYIVLKEDGGKGLSALPPVSRLDVYFDIEGHPLMDGGLEYLWGVSYQDTNAPQGKKYAFKDWWAHDQDQERYAFERFIDWVYQRWLDDPAMHIYHYASYEITAISKLANREQTRLQEVSELLKNGVFVDLYKIVKSGLLIGEPRYSIKNVEHLYREKRTTDVANGGESVVFYENWREQGGVEAWATQDNGYQNWLNNPDGFDWEGWPVLNEIRLYNIDDCESTLELVDWLRAQQTKSGIAYSAPEPVEEKEKTEHQVRREALALRQQNLITQFEATEDLKQDPIAHMLKDLLHFYDRENKPSIWKYYERLEKMDTELFEDDTVLYDITITNIAHEENNLRCTATYSSDQPVRTDKFNTATIQGTDVSLSKFEFNDLNQHQGEVHFSIKPEFAEALQPAVLTLFANEININTSTLENRLCEITENYFSQGTLSGVLQTILNQAKPQLTQNNIFPISRQRYLNDDDYLNAIIQAIDCMNNTCLCIQGPPGAGKTYTAKNVIKALVDQGKRIGIMSNSHAAIMNLLGDVISMLPDANIVKVGGYGTQKNFNEYYAETYPTLIYRDSMKFTKKQPYEEFQVIGATVYGFAKDTAHESPVDYLFVDEASQVALANLVAASGAAHNIILMGDQMQLDQPIQGSHPGHAGSSALEFMLKEHSVIPDDKGIFLERTYRMHPAVCQPLSDVVYEGKLQAAAGNEKQAIHINEPHLVSQQSGILPIRVKHEGNSQSSEEEVTIIMELITELKTGTFTNKEGERKPITDEDILIIAPYNMQVNLLKERLGDNYKIGTIDKFQGQEAPAVIISMAISDVDDSPRGLDFVFDLNRLNVAVSRAQALAIIVANEGLENCSVNSLQQMERVGFYIGLCDS